jgi:superfamily II DNA/RNA helicase
MNSFLGIRRQSTRRLQWWKLTTARRMSRSAEAHADAIAMQSAQPGKRITFDDLGLHPPILASLRAAFPNVQYPTEAQEKFIPAILSGRDVLLKDATGSGK